MKTMSVSMDLPSSFDVSQNEDDYTRCRAVVVSKNGLDIFFYFKMTGQRVKEFDHYLEDLNKVFRFKE